MNVSVKRIYAEPEHNDGTRVLVDRIWPRGLRKEDAHLDDWIKDAAPSTALRKWYGHDPQKFDEFAERYRDELSTGEGQQAVQALRETVSGKRLTLLTATKDLDLSHLRVLAQLLDE